MTARYPWVRLISQANAGPASARNRGAREARGRILLFTDDDCVPMPNWLDAMLACFKRSRDRWSEKEGSIARISAAWRRGLSRSSMRTSTG